MTNIRTLTLTACLVALPLGLAAAQPPAAQRPADRQGRGRAGANAAGLSPIDVLNMLDAYALVQAESALELKDTQYADFVARLKRLQETRRRNQVARNRLIQELRRLSAPQAKTQDDNAIRDRLKALKDHDDRAAAELTQAYSVLDEVLDLRQQARFRAFEEGLERRKIDLLMRARRGAAGRQEQ
jgi:DNA repair ATPase RecN